jgi:hypothetical protein
MSKSAMRDLFDRWERVWHDGQYDLIPSCVRSHYIRHDENGDRTVTRDAYARRLQAKDPQKSASCGQSLRSRLRRVDRRKH